MKLFIVYVKVLFCNIASSKPKNETYFNMRKFFAPIIAMIVAASNALAETHDTSSQSIILECTSHNENSGRLRSPLYQNIVACYNSERSSVDISYQGEAEGEVYIFLNEILLGYDSNINTSIPIPPNPGTYSILIIGSNWEAHGQFQL